MEGFLSFRIDEIDKLMEICHRIEVLGHLSTDTQEGYPTVGGG